MPRPKPTSIIVKNVFTERELAVLQRIADERGTNIAEIIALALERFIEKETNDSCRGDSPRVD